MIELIRHDKRFSYLVFDEPTDAYRDMMLLAASDNKHDLHLNYKGDIIKESYFVTIVLRNDEPMEIFGLEKTQWSYVARGFYRAYKPESKRGHDLGFWDLQSSKAVMNFYKWYPYQHRYNIDTIFITRNYKPKTKFSKYLEKSDASYYEDAGAYTYRKTPQNFYVWGNKRFLSDLPVYEPDKESRQV